MARILGACRAKRADIITRALKVTDLGERSRLLRSLPTCAPPIDETNPVDDPAALSPLSSAPAAGSGP
jgi:hypothetical protein